MARRLALLIACNDYQDARLAPLVAPPRDVRDLADALGDPEVGAFEVEALVNPTYDEARRKIDDFFSTSDPNDFQLLYFSGHGIRDSFGNLYLAAVNTIADRFQSTAIEGGFVQQSMRLSLSRQQVLVLDCCYSGAFANGRWAKGSDFKKVAARFQARGRVVMTASSEGQLAFETEGADGVRSVFTHWLVRGLRSGEADVDRDGLITAEELYYFARRAVVEEQNQQPHLFSDGMTGQLILARNPHAEAGDVAGELPAYAPRPYAPTRDDGLLQHLRSRLSRRVMAGAVAAVLALAVAGAIILAPDAEGGSPTPTAPDSEAAAVEEGGTVSATFLRAWGENGAEPGQYDNPTSLTAGTDGTLYLADSGNDRVQQFDEFGEHLLTFCEPGIEERRCVAPVALAVNRDGILYVADSGNNRIQQFDRDGSLIRSWGSFSPWGLALDSAGNIYAIDLLGQQVRVFNPDGVALRTFGQQGDGDGEFRNPEGIYIDRDDRVYVGDKFNRRVQVFDAQGGFIRTIGSNGVQGQTLDNPSAIASDERGNIFVADENLNQVLVYRPDGAFVTAIGRGGKNAGEFDHPAGLAITGDTLYVVDQGNNRIQKFALAYS